MPYLCILLSCLSAVTGSLFMFSYPTPYLEATHGAAHVQRVRILVFLRAGFAVGVSPTYCLLPSYHL